MFILRSTKRQNGESLERGEPVVRERGDGWRARLLVALCLVGLMGAGVGASAAAATLPNGRAYELVSPPDKNGGEVMPNSPRTRAAADGAAVGFASLVGFGDVVGFGVATEYVAERSTNPAPGGTGWSTHGTTPQQDSLTFLAGAASVEPHYVGAFSDDLRKGLYRAWSPLTDDPMVPAATNLYLRNDLRTPGAGTYELVTACPICVSPLPDISRGYLPGFAGASTDFEHLLFESPLDLTPGPGPGPDPFPNTKLYEASPAGVSLVGILPDGRFAVRSRAGQGVFTGPNVKLTSRPISADGSSIVFTVGPDQLATDGDLYMRINGRTTIQLNASERATPDAVQRAKYWNASTDHRRVFLTTVEALTDDAPSDTDTKLYMWSRASSDETQSIAVSATSGTYRLSLGGPATTTIPFDAPAADVQAALEALPQIGPGNVGVAGGPGDAGGTAPYEVTFVGDLSGVNVAQLTANGAGLSGGSAVVTTSVPVRNLTYLNVDQEPLDATNDVVGVFEASDDGRYVYFAALGQLVAGGPRLGLNWGYYGWHDGTITYIGEGTAFLYDGSSMMDGSLLASRQRQTDVTPDGRTFLFPSSTGRGLLSQRGGRDYDHGTCPGEDGFLQCLELYVYRADDDTLVCASCNPTGAPATASALARIRTASGGTTTATYVSRVLSDDGRYVFFTTREALVDEDVNNRLDAYVYDVQDGRPHLLSSGTSASNSYFLESSASGADAFFTTREQLVGWDVDDASDLYDARIGGGFPEPPTSPPSCRGAGCQPSPSTAPPAQSVGSAVTQGAGNARPAGRKPARRVVRCARGKVKKVVRGKARCVKRRSHAAGKRAHRVANTRRAK